jgi:hypothetical protein
LPITRGPLIIWFICHWATVMTLPALWHTPIYYHSIIMSWIAPKQNAFKFKIAPHEQKSIVKKTLAGIFPPPILVNRPLCLSIPKHNGKSALCVHDSEHGMDNCINQHMKFKMKQTRHNNLFFSMLQHSLFSTSIWYYFKIKRFSLAFGFLAEFYFIVLWTLQQVANCWLDTLTPKEQ